MHSINTTTFLLNILYLALDDQPFVPSGDSADEEETIDMEEESAAKVLT